MQIPRKRLDVYFIKNLMFRRAHQQLSESLRLMTDEDLIMSTRIYKVVRKNYEDDYKENIKRSKKEYKRIIKERRKKAKNGEINQNEELALYLQSIGVEFLELELESEADEDQEINKQETKEDPNSDVEEALKIDAQTEEKEGSKKETVEQEEGQEQGNTAE